MRELQFWKFIILVASIVTCLSAASNPKKPIPYALVVGTVYCDTCFHQDFSKASHFISGAWVAVECRDRRARQPAGLFRQVVKTNEHGEFKVQLPLSISKHVKKIKGCSVKLISSSEPFCAVGSSAASSSLHLKSKNEGIRIFSAGFFTFRPLKQPEVCDQKPSFWSPKKSAVLQSPENPVPFFPPNPLFPPPSILPPNPLFPPPSLLPPNPLFPPPSLLPPNPFQPPPSIMPPIFPSPPPSIFPPIFPSPPPSIIPPIFPSPSPPPSLFPPIFPSPFPPRPPPPSAFPPISPFPPLIPGLTPPPPTFPAPLLPPSPFQPTPGFPGVPPTVTVSTTATSNPSKKNTP